MKKPVTIDPVSDPDGAIEHLIGLLPPELHDASCWWQFTSSQSLPDCEDTLSARLWFWLLDPLDDAALTRWALSANKAFGGRLIDPSLYRAVQPHYVANPIFEDGMIDPLPRRHGVRVGLDKAVSLLIPEPSADDPYVDGEGYVGLGIEGHLAEIGGERGFRAPMVSAIAAYFTANVADANPKTIKAKVRTALAHADPGGRSAADIDRYCSDRHLNDIIGWVRARERANPRPKSPLPDLKSIADSVPVEGERATAVRAIAGAVTSAVPTPEERLDESVAKLTDQSSAAEVESFLRQLSAARLGLPAKRRLLELLKRRTKSVFGGVGELRQALAKHGARPTRFHVQVASVVALARS